MLWSTIGMTGVKDFPIPAPYCKLISGLQLSEHTKQPIPFSHKNLK